jgi:hypothetical protein
VRIERQVASEEGQVVVHQIANPLVMVSRKGQRLTPKQPVVDNQSLGSSSYRAFKSLQAGVNGKSDPVKEFLAAGYLKAVQREVCPHPRTVVEGFGKPDIKLVERHGRGV